MRKLCGHDSGVRWKPAGFLPWGSKRGKPLRQRLLARSWCWPTTTVRVGRRWRTARLSGTLDRSPGGVDDRRADNCATTVTDDLAWVEAVEQAAMVRRGDVTPLELV